MKLLATSSVANNFFGLSSKSEMIFPLEAFPCIVSSTSVCDNENNATSAPETNAEHISNTAIPINPYNRLVSTVYARIKLGSGSKLYKIS